MAQTMKNVKAVTIPEGTVKKIEDSNGNIIWGSYAAFPYRRLEYLYFNGIDNYVNLGGKISYSRIDTAIAELISVDNEDAVAGGYSYNGTWPRYYLPRFVNNGSNARFAISSTWTSNNITYPLNTKLRFSIKVGANATSACTCTIKNEDTNTVILNEDITPTAASGGSTSNNPTVYLGALSSKLNASDTEHAVNFTECKIYFWSRTSYDGTTVKYDAYPVQRKSDGAFGFYFPSNNLFAILEGTQTSATAGPVVDEYWDLTA